MTLTVINSTTKVNIHCPALPKHITLHKQIIIHKKKQFYYNTTCFKYWKTLEMLSIAVSITWTQLSVKKMVKKSTIRKIGFLKHKENNYFLK